MEHKRNTPGGSHIGRGRAGHERRHTQLSEPIYWRVTPIGVYRGYNGLLNGDVAVERPLSKQDYPAGHMLYTALRGLRPMRR